MFRVADTADGGEAIMSNRKALQLHRPEIVQLLTLSLCEEQNAGQLLDQVAQPLMSVARMPASFE